MNLQAAIRDLRVLDLQNPGIWPTWVHFATALLAGVVVVFAGLWFKLMPMSDELTEAQQQEAVLLAEFDRKHGKVVALDAYKEQLRDMERSFGTMLKQLPSRSEVANLLNDISQARVASRLREELFQPEPEVVKEFYAEIPNRIVVTGRYHEMGSFVSGVAALPRIVTVDDVEIRPVKLPATPRSTDAAPEGELRMTAVAKTYRYLDESEIEAAAAEKKKTQRGSQAQP